MFSYGDGLFDQLIQIFRDLGGKTCSENLRQFFQLKQSSIMKGAVDSNI